MNSMTFSDSGFESGSRPRLLSAQQAQDFLGVGRSTLYLLTKRGLPFVQYAKQRMYLETDLIEFAIRCRRAA